MIAVSLAGIALIIFGGFHLQNPSSDRGHAKYLMVLGLLIAFFGPWVVGPQMGFDLPAAPRASDPQR